MEAVVHVVANEDYSLLLTFSTGEIRLFDARPYLEKGVFTSLKDVARFKQAHVAFDTVCWPGRLDIAPETLYDRSVPVQALQAAETMRDYRAAESPDNPSAPDVKSRGTPSTS